MNHSGILRRHGALAAVLALIMSAAFFLADAAMPRSAEAKPAADNQQVEALAVAGSQIDIFVLDHDMEDLQWAGVIDDPLGNDLTWTTWDNHGGFTRLDQFTDVEEGEFTVIPATPVAPGWEVYGYRIIPDGGWSDCGLNTLDYTDDPTFEVTPANPDWVVCIAVMPEGGIPGSLLTIEFVAPSVPGFWAGKLDVPFGNNDPLLADLVGGVSGHWHNGKAGTYWVLPTNQPKPGLWTYGFYSFESDSIFPDCPSDPSLYEPSKTYLGITEEKPHWAMCVMALDTIPDIRLTLKVDGPLGVDWQGTVTALGLNATWADWGVDSTSLVGSRTDIDPINHLFLPNDPVAPGWSVVSYAVFESTDPNPDCPTDIQAYNPYGLAYVHPMHPAWAVCVKVTQEVPATGTHIEVRTGSQSGPTGWVDGPGNYDFSWLFMGVQPASSSGYLDDVPYGTYNVLPASPPLAGQVVAGYYAMETDDIWESCPSDAADYALDAGTVQVSPQHPVWTVCVLLEDEPEPVTPDPPPSSTPELPYDIPNYNDPGMPGSASTPSPTATPSPAATATPTEIPGSPTTTSEPESTSTPEPAGTPVPGGGSGNGGVAGVATPVAPDTGDTGTRGSSQSAAFEAGLLLLALGACAVAAKQLPARRKR